MRCNVYIYGFAGFGKTANLDKFAALFEPDKIIDNVPPGDVAMFDGRTSILYLGQIKIINCRGLLTMNIADAIRLIEDPFIPMPLQRFIGRRGY